MTDGILKNLVDNTVSRINEALNLSVRPPPLTTEGSCCVLLENDRELWRSLSGSQQEREAQITILTKSSEADSAVGTIIGIADYLNSVSTEDFSTDTAAVTRLSVGEIYSENQTGDWIARITIKIKYSF